MPFVIVCIFDAKSLKTNAFQYLTSNVKIKKLKFDFCNTSAYEIQFHELCTYPDIYEYWTKFNFSMNHSLKYS